MENHKIDRLFQDKLSRHEIDPSPAAWEAINAELNRDKRPMVWLRIAASVVLVAAIGWLILRDNVDEVDSNLAYFTPDHPTMQTPYIWNLPIEDKAIPEKASTPAKKKTKQPLQVVPVVEFESSETLAKQEVEMTDQDILPRLEPLGLDAMVLTEIAVQDNSEVSSDEPIQALPGVSVQITYRATPPVKVEEKSRIERLWAKAKEIKPGEVLADIRETKNDFFNGKKN